MNTKIKNIIKAGAFLLVALVLLYGMNSFFKRDWNAEALNIYDEPENTIETVFIGSSMIEFGIDVMTMYEEYGICAYNLGNSGQPVPASNYWLEELYKLQSESLKTVVFDVSIVRTKLPTSYYRTATDNMKLSATKYDAVASFSQDFNETVSYLFPLFSYHSRWNELNSSDFDMANSMLYRWSRGQCFSTDTAFSVLTAEQLMVPDYALDENAEQIELDAEGLEYLDQMIAFCEENDLELILIKTPNPINWSSGAHNTFETLAKEKDLVFLDFNYGELLSGIDYDCMFDSMDGIHLNYYGSEKFALWMGNYLIENGYAHDIRGQEKYAFLEDELKEYKETFEHLVAMRECADPVDYLKLAGQKDEYTILVTVKGDGAKALTEEQRAQFAEMGMEKLSTLDNAASYIAVIDGGKVVYETSENTKLIYHGELSSGGLYTLESGGSKLGNIATCTIEGKNYALNTTGMNIVVYDNSLKTVIDKTVFNTNEYFEREVAVESILQEKLDALAEGEEVPKTLEKYVEYLELLENQ